MSQNAVRTMRAIAAVLLAAGAALALFGPWLQTGEIIHDGRGHTVDHTSTSTVWAQEPGAVAAVLAVLIVGLLALRLCTTTVEGSSRLLAGVLALVGLVGSAVMVMSVGVFLIPGIIMTVLLAVRPSPTRRPLEHSP